jgi:hypothetical protein
MCKHSVIALLFLAALLLSGSVAATAGSEATEGARAVVEAYWSSSWYAFEPAYGLLADAYKRRLRNALGIRNAKEYAKATNIPERMWRGQTYQRISIVRPGVVQAVVLAEWEQEGYEGVATFIFDLVRQNGVWRIEHIMR